MAGLEKTRHTAKGDPSSDGARRARSHKHLLPLGSFSSGGGGYRKLQAASTRRAQELCLFQQEIPTPWHCEGFACTQFSHLWKPSLHHAM